MAYGTYDKHVLTDVEASGATTPIALEASAAVVRTWEVYEPIQVTRVGIKIAVTFNYDTQTQEGILKFKRYIAYGSATGAIELGTITLTDTAAAGKCVYIDVDTSDGRGDCKGGEQIVAEITTAGTGGGSIAGDFLCYVCYNPRAETTANQSYMKAGPACA